VEAAPRRLGDYRGVVPDELLDEATALAGALWGARILQVTKRIHNAMQGQAVSLEGTTEASTSSTTGTAPRCSTTRGT
jgi:hypothetical protein